MNLKNYCYFVEGPDDKKVVDTLKTQLKLIYPGKVFTLNVVQEKITKLHLRNLKNNTILVLVYDVDTNNTDVLQENLNFLKKQSIIKEVVCIPQVLKLEEELVRSCSIKSIKELTNSKSNSDFKKDVLKISNLDARLKNTNFDFSKFWCTKPKNSFSRFPNDSKCIRKEF